jgi:hypothetical protein
VQAKGMHGTFLQKLLRESNPEDILIKTLLIIGQMARIAKKDSAMRHNYDLIHRADVYSALRKLFSHKAPVVRMRLCSLIGASATYLRTTVEYFGAENGRGSRLVFL